LRSCRRAQRAAASRSVLLPLGSPATAVRTRHPRSWQIGQGHDGPHCSLITSTPPTPPRPPSNIAEPQRVRCSAWTATRRDHQPARSCVSSASAEAACLRVDHTAKPSWAIRCATGRRAAGCNRDESPPSLRGFGHVALMAEPTRPPAPIIAVAGPISPLISGNTIRSRRQSGCRDRFDLCWCSRASWSGAVHSGGPTHRPPRSTVTRLVKHWRRGSAWRAPSHDAARQPHPRR